MKNQENYHTLLLRNQTSLILDDLVALVINSALAEQLRTFSGELMDMTPGFTFTLKQAQRLKNEADKTLKGYSRGSITDDDLMIFLSNGKGILRGETLEIGGNNVSLFDKLLHGKEIKKKEALTETQKQYDDVCKQIDDCKATMDRCVAESRHLDPSSPVRRNHARTYDMQKRRLALLGKQEELLRKTLDEAGMLVAIEEHNKFMQETEKRVNVVLGSDAERTKKVEEVTARQDLLNERTSRMDLASSSLFETPVSEEPITDTEFDALVAASEVREFRTAAANGTVAEPKAQMSEFDALVSASEE